MDHAVDEGDDGDIFIYRGGRAPQHITHVLIDKSVDEIEDNAFLECENLLQVHTHDGIRRVGGDAFVGCELLRHINLKSAVEIDEFAFYGCGLESVEFGDRLETIERSAFERCSSLKHLKLPSVITIGIAAFSHCKRLTDIELSERLESIKGSAFWQCERLERIVIPLKRDLFEFTNTHLQAYDHFFNCKKLTTVELVGGIYTTVASLHMDRWRTEMIVEINRINHVLPTTHHRDKTYAIQQWIGSVIDQMDHYKAEHIRYVKEGITLLELALWKAKLGEREDDCTEGKAKKAKIDVESKRNERRVTCGADIVINNVLPFLQLDE